MTTARVLLRVSDQGCRLLLFRMFILTLVLPVLLAQSAEDTESNTGDAQDTELISEESNSTFNAWNGTGLTDRERQALALNLTEARGSSPLLDVGDIKVQQISSVSPQCSAQLYSCEGRCGALPRTACSCHYTCQIYGNCCEDYADFCQLELAGSEIGTGQHWHPRDAESIQSLVQSNLTSVACLGGSLVITSCSPGFDDNHLGEMKNDIEVYKDSTNFKWIFEQMSDLQAHEFVSGCAEPTVDGTNYLGDNPVTVNDTGLHFRNFYCAVCNGFSSLQFWLGFGVCSETELPLKDVDHAQCERPMVYLPTEGNPNSCFLDSQLVLSGYEHEERDTIQLGNFTAPALYNRNNTLKQETHGSSVSNGSHLLVLDTSSISDIDLVFDVTNASTSAKPNKLDTDVLALEEKCRQLTAYVSVLPDSKKVYKNIYCYRLLHSEIQLPSELCEPAVPRLPVEISGHYKTFWPQIVSSDRDRSVGIPGQGGPTGLSLAAMDFSENKYIFMLLGMDSLPSCDAANFIIVNGNCLRVAFFLHIFVSFDFERSSLIKGDYRESSESYVRFVSDTMTGQISPQFFCEAIHVKTTELSKREHEGEIQLQCVELPVPMELDNAEDGGDSGLGQLGIAGELGDDADQPPQTVNGEPVTDARVKRYLDFATDGFQAIHSGTGVMKLPGTVQIRLCLTDMFWSLTPQASNQYHDYCASYTLRWQAHANVDGVVGEISLEGIITIICCVLSNIGLLVRLALQQVVPFYKTYPAKVQFCLCLTLLLAYTLFLLGGIVDEASRACRIISTMTHLAFLSALFWMNVTAFEIWRTFRHWRNQVVSRGRASLVLSALYAVGIPLSIVITALVIEELYPWSEFSPNYGEYFCWLNGSMAVAIYFVTPCSAICGMNAIFVGLTLRGLRRQRTSISEFKKSNTVTAITDTTIVVKIILLVGITWLLGLLAAMVNHQVLWIIFTVINASLGFLISAVLVLNKRVFYAIQKKCLCYNTDSIAVVSTQVARH